MYIKYIQNVEKRQSGDSIQTSNNALKIELRSPNYVYFKDVKTYSLCESLILKPTTNPCDLRAFKQQLIEHWPSNWYLSRRNFQVGPSKWWKPCATWRTVRTWRLPGSLRVATVCVHAETLEQWRDQRQLSLGILEGRHGVQSQCILGAWWIDVNCGEIWIRFFGVWNLKTS